MTKHAFLAFVLTIVGAGVVLGASEVTRFVLGGAGGEVQSSRHSITATIGEPVVGEATSATHTLRAGFLHRMAVDQIAQRLHQIFGVKNHLLPQRQRRGLMVDAESE